MDKILSREQFTTICLKRDGGKCVFCKKPATEVHHILDRKLFDNGGYYEDNGASVCGKCHLLCEDLSYTIRQVREACNIKQIVIPPDYDINYVIDKWGNIHDGDKLILSELFITNTNLSKLIKEYGVMNASKYKKYPRTLHLPWSEGMTNDDKILKSLDNFIGKRVIVTQKYDGENTSIYCDHTHARSLDSANHPSRDWLKKFAAEFQHNLPEKFRICGENLYAKHSIGYNDLESYFYGFSMWDDNNVCLSWDETVEWFQLLGVTPVQVLYDGLFDQGYIKSLFVDDGSMEGYVVRLADAFSYEDFGKSVAKFVRKNHIQTLDHWMFQEIIPNKLKEI